MMTSREAFEQDAEPYGYSLKRAECSCCDYDDTATDHRWKGWQASRAALLEEIKAGGAAAWEHPDGDKANHIKDHETKQPKWVRDMWEKGNKLYRLPDEGEV
jgi:hypothetical protein